MIESVVDYNASHPTDSIKISLELEKSKRVGLEKLLPHAHVVSGVVICQNPRLG